MIDVVRERDSDFHQSSDGTVQHDLTNGVPTGQFYTGGPPASVNGEPVSPERRVPRMPYYRNNLTALSQKYNVGTPATTLLCSALRTTFDPN